MNNSDSTAQRTIEERILHDLGISHGNIELDGIKFNFDGISGDTIYEVYAGIDKLLSGQQHKISQDILKMVLYEKMIKKQISKVLIVIDNKIHDILSYEKHKSWKSRAIIEYGIEVRLVSITPEERLMLEKAKEAQGGKFKNPS